VNGKTFQGKYILLLATSPGPRGGKSVLETATNRFPFHDGKIIGTFSLPEFNKNFDDDLGIVHPEYKALFYKTIEDVKAKLML
jgi:NAD(P)H-dependent FMN reductase